MNVRKHTNDAPDKGSKSKATWRCSTRPQSVHFNDPSSPSWIHEDPKGQQTLLEMSAGEFWPLSQCPETPCRQTWTVAEYTCFQNSIQEKQGVSAKNLGSKTCCVPTILRSEGGGGHSHSSQCFTRWPSTQSMDLSQLVKTRQISGNLRQLLAPDIPPQRWD